MEQTIEIDGRPVAFRATAAIPRLYRRMLNRDVIQDMQALQSALQAAGRGEAPIPPDMLELFENLAYVMALHACPELPQRTPEDWLDTFETFSVYEIFPRLLALWQANNRTLAEAKKKDAPSTGT